MKPFDFGMLVGEDRKEQAKRWIANVVGAATAKMVADRLRSAGCGSAMCSTAVPVVAGIAAAVVASDVVDWVWGEVYG